MGAGPTRAGREPPSPEGEGKGFALVWLRPRGPSALPSIS